MLAVVATTVVTLLCIELALRIGGVQPFPEAAKEQISYEENSRGLRDYEYDYGKADDVFRIVVAGDSFTYGTGVDSVSYIFPKRLERLLNGTQERGLKYEVINGAQPGFNTPEEYKWLRTEGIKYSPDLIIVVYFFNDATYLGTCTSLTRPIHERAAEESKSWSLLYSYIRYRIERRLMTRRTTEEYREAYFEAKGGMTKSGLWEKGQECILGIRDLAEKNDAGLLFVTFPILVDLDEDHAFQDIHDIVVDFISENGIEVHSLLPAFVEYKGSAESLWVSIVNAHPNEKGHEIAAQSLAAYLLESGLLEKR